MSPLVRRAAFGAALAASLAALLAHARLYAFLCDDAFISFRYARNLAEGHGLVFNPGFERVEGYTNFLWVLILAALDRLGWAPERAANILLTAMTVGLWGLVAWFAARERDEGEPLWPALVPPVLLACCRSVAVWSTSGLETRLFELLTVGATLRLVVEIEARGAGRRPRPWGAVLFALATLTRPDGLLIAAAGLSAGAVASLRRRLASLGEIASQALVFWVIVGAHFVWRRIYYGAWLPNTYYAKVGGRSWWDMGGAYLGSFALEYGMWLWLPLVAIGIVSLWRRGAGTVPLLFAAAVVPHAVYVASIGGDHFEYRPLDLYLPFLFLLAGSGVRSLASARTGRVPVAALALASAALFGVAWFPARAHAQFVTEYRAGFPGERPDTGEVGRFLDPASDPVYRWPGLRAIAAAYRASVKLTTSRFVGIRQEEHRMFLDTVLAQGERLRALVEAGVLPRDTHIATSCVGAIPYVSGLRTLDRLGLTDAAVARSAPSDLRIMAHDKHATIEYARRIGVDLWAEDPVHLVFDVDDPALVFHVERAEKSGEEVWFASTRPGEMLLARLPQGGDAARLRFPRLRWLSVHDPEALAAWRAEAAAAARKHLDSMPAGRERSLAEAAQLAQSGDLDRAIAAYRAIGGDDVEVLYNLGLLLGKTGSFGEATGVLERAVQLQPDFGPAWQNLGVALLKSGRADEAVRALSRAAALQPDDPETRFALGAACVTVGDAACVARERGALEALGTPEARRLAGKLGGAR